MIENKKIIEIKNLNVTYNKEKKNQVRALEGVSLEIEAEEWVIFFGPSGCGKSTLLNSIAGLETPTSGEVKVLGKNIYNLSSDEKSEYRGLSIGMIFQSFHLINSLTVLENICLPQVFYGQSPKKRTEMAEVLLERFGIKNQANKYPIDMSGGQRQKVSIARALMNQPEIILADEPVGNLDSKSTYNVMMILKELNSIDKKTIIMVTHDRQHLKFADKIIYIKDGKVIKTEKIKKQKTSNSGEASDWGKRLVKIEKDTQIPMDLKLLMRSFKDFSGINFGELLEPFKIKQTFAHLMLPITNHQAELTKGFMQEYFLNKIDKKEFFNKLDKPFEEGGANWDKRNANNFVDEVTLFYTEAQKINYAKTFESASRLSKFFIKRYSINETEYRNNILKSSVEERLNNEISQKELAENLSKPTAEDGLGLNKRTAEKITRELELLILIRYSG